MNALEALKQAIDDIDAYSAGESGDLPALRLALKRAEEEVGAMPQYRRIERGMLKGWVDLGKVSPEYFDSMVNTAVKRA